MEEEEEEWISVEWISLNNERSQGLMVWIPLKNISVCRKRAGASLSGARRDSHRQARRVGTAARDRG
jgi:hypothetical protein